MRHSYSRHSNQPRTRLGSRQASGPRAVLLARTRKTAARRAREKFLAKCKERKEVNRGYLKGGKIRRRRRLPRRGRGEKIPLIALRLGPLGLGKGPRGKRGNGRGNRAPRVLRGNRHKGLGTRSRLQGRNRVLLYAGQRKSPQGRDFLPCRDSRRKSDSFLRAPRL